MMEYMQGETHARLPVSPWLEMVSDGQRLKRGRGKNWLDLWPIEVVSCFFLLSLLSSFSYFFFLLSLFCTFSVFVSTLIQPDGGQTFFLPVSRYLYIESLWKVEIFEVRRRSQLQHYLEFSNGLQIVTWDGRTKCIFTTPNLVNIPKGHRTTQFCLSFSMVLVENTYRRVISMKIKNAPFICIHSIFCIEHG